MGIRRRRERIPGRGIRTVAELLRRERGSDFVETITRSHMALNTTTRCQQRCVYCFEGDRAGMKDLDRETVRSMLRDTARRVPGVVFMGAEPTLNPDIVDHVAYARELGLGVQFSTNALRFQSRRFLDMCVAAGLSGCEVSFPYPDAKVYSLVTGGKARGYELLLQALGNINQLNRERRGRTPAEPFFGLNVNVVVSRFNHRRLREVFATARSRLADTPFVVTMKMLNPFSTEPAAMTRFRRRYFVPLRELRRDFADLLADEKRDFPVMFRGYPMCVLPGREELCGDLYHHLHGPNTSLVIGNLERNQRYVRHMHSWTIKLPGGKRSAACGKCSLENICLERMLPTYAPRMPRNAPVPSRRPAREVLAAVGMHRADIEALLRAPLRYESAPA